MSSFVFLNKILRRNKIQVLAGVSFDLPATWLWAQHAYTAPSCSDAVFTRCFCTLNVRIVRFFLLLFKMDGLNYLRSDLVFWSDFVKAESSIG